MIRTTSHSKWIQCIPSSPDEDSTARPRHPRFRLVEGICTHSDNCCDEWKQLTDLGTFNGASRSMINKPFRLKGTTLHKHRVSAKPGRAHAAKTTSRLLGLMLIYESIVSTIATRRIHGYRRNSSMLELTFPTASPTSPFMSIWRLRRKFPPSSGDDGTSDAFSWLVAIFRAASVVSRSCVGKRFHSSGGRQW